MATDSRQLEVVKTMPGTVLAVTGNVVFAIWRGSATEEMYRRINEELVQLTTRYPRNCAYMQVIEASAKPPTAADRKIAMDGVKAVGDELPCVVVVVEGTAIRSTLVRAVLTGMTLLIPRMQKTKILGRVEDGPTWIKKTLGLNDENFEADLRAKVEEIRRQIPPP